MESSVLLSALLNLDSLLRMHCHLCSLKQMTSCLGLKQEPGLWSLPNLSSCLCSKGLLFSPAFTEGRPLIAYASGPGQDVTLPFLQGLIFPLCLQSWQIFKQTTEKQVGDKLKSGEGAIAASQHCLYTSCFRV